MKDIKLDDFDQALPDQMSLGVVMCRKKSSHPWADYSYSAIGVVAVEHDHDNPVRQIYKDDEVTHFLFSGLLLRLHVDECESYYHNLMSPEPGCFIVASEPEDSSGMPEPYLVSLSFDEVHAYLEGDEQIFSVEIPRKLYQWAEAYILTHYVAVKKKKRKLKDWSSNPESAEAAVVPPGEETSDNSGTLH